MVKFELPRLSIGIVEHETGIPKETLRKWEERYHFPLPARDSFGERQYTLGDVERLQLIKALLNTGLRPSHVVALPLEELLSLKACRIPPQPAQYPEQIQAILTHLRANDAQSVQAVLQQMLVRQGLSDFVVHTLATLNAAVGEAWEQATLTVFQEHLYTEIIRNFVVHAIDLARLNQTSRSVLLTTPSGEQHSLGLLMAQAMFALAGYQCHYLGTQMPVNEIAAAARAFEVQRVGISLSVNFPRRLANLVADDVRSALPTEIDLWIGGAGAVHVRKKIPGVRTFESIAALREALRHDSP